MRLLSLFLLLLSINPAAAMTNFSLRFFGTGTGDIDRVKVVCDRVGNLINLSGDLTIEFWLKAFSNENTASVSPDPNENWMSGNIIIDRDSFGPGDYGDYGISLGNGRIAFCVTSGTVSRTILGSTFVANGTWHHIAVTRSLSAAMRIFVNGTQDAFHASGPAGNIFYRTGLPPLRSMILFSSLARKSSSMMRLRTRRSADGLTNSASRPMYVTQATSNVPRFTSCPRTPQSPSLISTMQVAPSSATQPWCPTLSMVYA